MKKRKTFHSSSASWVLYTAYCILLCGFAGATLIHVPGDYPTIQAGITAAQSGDIVLVAAGHYPEEIQLKSGVIVQGAGEGLSIIDGGGNSGDVVTAVGNSIRSDTKFMGFTVTGAISGGGMPGGAGIFCNSGAAPDISQDRLTGSDFGIALWNNSVPVIHNNVIIHNNYFNVDLSTAASIINNTIGFAQIGLDDGGGYGPAVMNNIFIGHTRYGVYAVGTQPQLTYNDVWANDTDYRNCVPGTGSDSADPVFADTAAGDYHLKPASPCINAGNPAPEYNDPDGSRNDMGAYGGPGAAVARPQANLLNPARNALNVPESTAVSAGFNVPMNPANINRATFRLYGSLTGPDFGVVSYDTTAKMANLLPARPLRPGEVATTLLTRAVTSAHGDSLGGFAWQFTGRVSGGSGLFEAPNSTRVDSFVNTVVSADFNRDGRLDLATASPIADEVSVLLGSGDGSFAPATSYPLGSACNFLVAADFNNDSLLDIAVSLSEAGEVAILLGNGDGTFTPGAAFSTVTAPHGIAVGDFDADGNLDLAVVGHSGGVVAIHQGHGNGTFDTAITHTVGTSPMAVVTGDFNNDGRLDLAVANYGSDNVSVLLGDGNGGFGTAANFIVGTNPSGLVATDFNGDGNLDLATSNYGSSDISVLLGNGTGGFAGVVNYFAGGVLVGLIAADLNGDGALDLACGAEAEMSAAVLLGTGRGTFADVDEYPAGSIPHWITDGDFDGDGDVDLVTANPYSSSVAFLRNENALTVTNTEPANNEPSFPKSSDVKAWLSRPIVPASAGDSSFRILGAQSGPHSGVITWDSVSRAVTFNPGQDFLDGEPVSAILSHAIRTASGVRLQSFAWDFMTRISTPSAGTFEDRRDYSDGLEPRGAWAADFDGDGDVDIVTTSNSPSVVLLHNDGTGAFGNPIYTTVGGDPIALFAADFDRDGDVDLAVYHNEPGSSHLEILKNDSAGHFTVTSSSAPAILGEDISGGDLDGDGDIDLVLTDGWGSSDNVHVLFNNGQGSFGSPVNYSAGSGASGVCVKDVNDDGAPDIVVANSMNGTVSVLLNRGDGTFPTSGTYSTGASPSSVVLADLNGDHYADIVVSNYGAGFSVLKNNGNGTFGTAVPYAVNGARYLAIGDFNGDGNLDVAVACNGSDSLAVLFNYGTGVFSGLTSYAAGSGPWGILAADFDRDGDLDLACDNYSSNNITVWRNSGIAGLKQATGRTPLAAITASPNPFRGRVNLQFTTRESRPPNSAPRIRIYNASGQLVRELRLAVGGRQSAVWNGNDASGRTAASGVYYIRLAGDEKTVARVVKLD